MKKILPGLTSTFNVIIAGFAVAFQLLFIYSAYSQCGTSSFSAGGPYNPTGSFQSAAGTGSGTYQTFNISAGNIYSFEFSSATDNSGNDWDMTLSNGSAIIDYDNVNTPLPNSYYGGIGCPVTTRPASAVWYSTYSGTVVVNVNSWNGTMCESYISGQSSATLKYRECVPSGDPGPGTGGNWNVDAFATTVLSIPNFNARWGYYTDAASGQNFNSQNYWASTGVPSDASGWTGCTVSPENFTTRARRRGFNCGLYQFQVLSAADSFSISLNGNQIYASACCIGGLTVAGNPAGYVLTGTDQVEYLFNATCGASDASVQLAPLTPTAINGGSIVYASSSFNVCEGAPAGIFNNVTSPSGGTPAYTNGGNYSYQWQISTDGGGTWHNAGSTSGSSWTSTDTLPPGNTYLVRRATFDECGNVGYSNVITLIGVAAPNGELTPANQTICPNSSTDITAIFTSGLAPFNVVYTDGHGNNYPVNGMHSGDIISVAPLVTTTYSFFSITDSNGCSTTSGFNGAAIVQVETQLAIASVNVVDVACNGGSSGSITVNATNGSIPYSYSSDGGGTFESASSTLSGLDSGCYDVVVRDLIGCVATYANNPVCITQPPLLTESLTTTDASCSNVNNGCITVTAAGGAPPYRYAVNGGPSQTSNNLCGFPAGTYVADLIDANGCEDTESATINNLYVVALVVDSSSNESCYGSGDGSLTVHLVGGTPPFTYSINGVTFQASGTFTGLPSGTVTVIGKDVKGCTEFATVIISQPNPLTVILDSVKGSTCSLVVNGAIYIGVSGGTPGYTFAWSNGETGQNDTALAGGTYSVVVTDSKGCTAANSAIVSQTPPLSLNIALFTNPLCHDDSTGQILATANGGVPPYGYLWSTGITTQDIDSIPSGAYTLTVTDVSGCSSTISQALTNPTAITDVVSNTNIICYGTNSGTATVTASGGTPLYMYEWSNFRTSDSISGLSGGVYYVEITDHNGCHKWDSVSVAEPAPLLISFTVNNVSCFNANDGSITTAVTGGTQPYAYTWNPTETGPDPTGLAGGVYELTVTDSSGCSASGTATVINPLPIVATFVVRNTLCFGDSNGAINTTVSGGFPGYTFQWSNGFTTQNLSNLAGGLDSAGCDAYLVTITDSHGCSVLDSTVVCEPGPIYTSGIINNISCHNDCNGSVITTPYGGTVPYTFNWSNNETTENIVHLCGGNYTLTLTDVNGCSAISLYIITNPPQLTLSIIKSDISCAGLCNGEVVSIPGGGVTPYTYLWNNFSPDSLQNNICAGLYSLVLTDSNSCRVTDTATVSQPAPISITGAVTNILCNGASTGAITTTVTGGVTPYAFAWSNTGSTQSIAGLDSNTYALSVTDANSCTSTQSFNVSQPTAINEAVSLGKPLCHGGGNGFVSAAVTGGVPPYTYAWSTVPPQFGATAGDLTAGNYTLTVTDNNGCSSTVSANLPNADSISITPISIGSRCFNSASGAVIGVVSGGAPPYTYLVNGTLQNSDTFTNLLPGIYTIVVIDANGCQGSGSFTVTSPPSYAVKLTVNESDNGQFILTGMTTQLIATVTPDTGIIHYFWNPDSLMQFTDCADSTDCSNPFAAPTSTTTFMVTVENSDSCFVSDTITIYVEEQPVAFIPTAFTPNGDGLNDRFEFAILGANTIEISVFNRWGERVYYNPNQANGMTNTDGWDGTFDGKPSPEGTYVYQMKITYFDGTSKDRAGTINILR